jgi:two-component system, NarL family, sensor kinase
MQKGSAEIIKIIIAGAITFVPLIVLVIAFLIIYRKRQREYAMEKEQLKLSYERELLKTRLEIQEQTFRNISQEIHDNIGQVLSLAKLNISTMDVSRTAVLEQKISDSKKLISQAIYDLRNLSHGLSTDYIADQGLTRAIGHELEMIKKSGGFETVFLTDGSSYSLDKQKELIIYRIIQETLNNIIKHSVAQKIIIYLLYRPDEFTINISDNGKGFDLTPLNNNASSGLGIKNMHSRAQMIGAGFQISSTLGKGTDVNISVPVVPPSI